MVSYNGGHQILKMREFVYPGLGILSSCSVPMGLPLTGALNRIPA